MMSSRPRLVLPQRSAFLGFRYPGHRAHIGSGVLNGPLETTRFDVIRPMSSSAGSDSMTICPSRAVSRGDGRRVCDHVGRALRVAAAFAELAQAI